MNKTLTLLILTSLLLTTDTLASQNSGQERHARYSNQASRKGTDSGKASQESEVSKKTRPTPHQWKTFVGPDKDFIVNFPVEPERDEFRGKSVSGGAEQLTRRYFALTDSLMLAVSFQDLGYDPESPWLDRIAPTYERRIKEVGRRDGWKIIRIRRLSNSVAETEAWDRAGAAGNYVHAISRTIVRNGQAYDLQCRSTFTGREVDRAVCDRFFNSFHVIGPPK